MYQYSVHISDCISDGNNIKKVEYNICTAQKNIEYSFPCPYITRIEFFMDQRCCSGNGGRNMNESLEVYRLADDVLYLTQNKLLKYEWICVCKN